MASCEKCWGDAYIKALHNPTRSQAEHYSDLIKERNCTPEEQAGEDAGVCQKCGRKAIHQYCNICMSCGYDRQKDL